VVGCALRDWVHGLVHHPTRPQRALLLTGSEVQSKTVFHDAMGLLLPDRGVLRFPEDFRFQGLAEGADPSDQSDRAKWLERFRLHIEGQRDDNDRQLKAAWLVVVEGAMALHMLHLRAFEQPRYRDGRFLKWSLASDHHELRRPITNTIRFDVRPPALVIPKPDLIRRLEDEREAFQATLQRYAA